MHNKYKSIIISVCILLLLAAGGVFAASSTTYNVQLIVTGALKMIVQWAIPEKRVGPAHTNDAVTFYLTVRDTSTNAVIAVSDLATTSPDGTDLNPIIINHGTPKNYNIAIKTDQHISRALHDVYLSGATTTLNYTQTDNSAPLGSVRLLAGDIDGMGNSTTTLGDNQINSVDLSILLNDLDNSDASGTMRADLNRDTVDNAVDLGMLIDNLDRVGEQ